MYPFEPWRLKEACIHLALAIATSYLINYRNPMETPNL